MNKRYIALGTVILVIAVFFVFFSQQEYSFDSGLTEINSAWEKQDLKPKDLTSPLKVFAVKETKLTELKADLISFKEKLSGKEDSADKEKLELLVETEIELVSNALLQKENFALIDFFDSSDYDYELLCSSMNKAELLQENLVLQKSSAESFNNKVIAFSDAYSDEAVKARINALELEVNSDEKLSEMQSVLSVLKEVC